jgi:hypothetical protein
MTEAQTVDYIGLWIEIGTQLIEIKAERCGNDNIRFGRWLADNLPELGKDDRAACMGLARCPDAVKVAHQNYEHCVSPFYVWLQVKHFASSNILEDAPDQNEETASGENEPAAPENVTEAPAETSVQNEPTDQKLVVGPRNAIVKWGELGEELFRWFEKGQTRAVWNNLVARRHGRELGEFALEQLSQSSLRPPLDTNINQPNARLVFPWLNSPLANTYDLTNAKSLQRLKDDAARIRQVCWPLFADGSWRDRANQCEKLFKQSIERERTEAHQIKVAALREEERRSVNLDGHPPVVCHGSEVWPDGDLPPELRLTYDEARFAFFLWREWDRSMAIGMPEVHERGEFWRSRQRVFHGLSFEKGLALSNFWHRCGTAMVQNPLGDSRCQPLIRVSR